MKKKILRLLALGLCIVICLDGIPPGVAVAKTAQERLREAQEEKKETEQSISENKDGLSDANSEHTALKKELNGLNGDLEDICGNLENLEEQIASKKAEIAETQDKLKLARETETAQYEAMKKRIQFMYEDSETLYLDILFQAESFSELITLSKYIDNLAAYDKKKFEEYQAYRIEVEDLEARLESENVELEILKAEAEDEKANVMLVIQNTSNQVSKYEGIIDAYEAKILEEEKKLAEQEELIKKIQEEIRLSQLSSNSVWRDISEITFDEGDRYLLANLIYCEAGGEIYDGQVAVGSVVINRVLSPVYPSTVTGVIYQKYQFSPVLSGRLAYALSVDKATASCYRAADEAMSGYSNVGTCVYFRTPIDGLTGIQIGNHIFY